MDVENATLLHIGEIKKTSKGLKLLKIHVSMPNGGPLKRFIIFQNRQSRFDLVKLFERKDHFKVGDIISFNYNKSDNDKKFDSIWKLKIRDERRQVEKDS